MPDSLELLLDTMCNTFGAIMFIAISLVVISQVTTRIIRDMKPPEITEEYLEQMRRTIHELEETVDEEERKMAERALVALGMPKQKKEKVERLLARKATSQRLILDLSRQANEKSKMNQEAENARRKLEDTKEDVKAMEVETTQKERALAQMLLNKQQKKKNLEMRIEQAEGMVTKQENQLKNMSPQTLTFSMDVSVGSAKQYCICLKNGRLYREESGEVTGVREDDYGGHFSFKGNGHLVSGNTEALFRSLLGTVNYGRYAIVFCDQASYDALVALRKYLRNRKVKMKFIHTEEFRFGYGGNIKASY